MCWQGARQLLLVLVNCALSCWLLAHPQHIANTHTNTDTTAAAAAQVVQHNSQHPPDPPAAACCPSQTPAQSQGAKTPPAHDTHASAHKHKDTPQVNTRSDGVGVGRGGGWGGIIHGYFSQSHATGSMLTSATTGCADGMQLHTAWTCAVLRCAGLPPASRGLIQGELPAAASPLCICLLSSGC